MLKAFLFLPAVYVGSVITLILLLSLYSIVTITFDGHTLPAAFKTSILLSTLGITLYLLPLLAIFLPFVTSLRHGSYYSFLTSGFLACAIALFWSLVLFICFNLFAYPLFIFVLPVAFTTGVIYWFMFPKQENKETGKNKLGD